MKEIDVDEIRVKRLQRGLQICPHRLRTDPSPSGLQIKMTAFRKNHNPVPAARPFQPSAERFLCPAVYAGCIEDSYPHRQDRVEQRVVTFSFIERLHRRAENDP